MNVNSMCEITNQSAFTRKSLLALKLCGLISSLLLYLLFMTFIPFNRLRVLKIYVIMNRIWFFIFWFNIMMGTPYDHTKEFCAQFPGGMLWYLDNCEQTMPALYRTLWQMRYAGWFDNANGILVGRTYSGGPFDDYEFTDVLHDVFDDLKVPVVYDVDLGHVPAQWTFINGAEGEFESLFKYSLEKAGDAAAAALPHLCVQ